MFGVYLSCNKFVYVIDPLSDLILLFNLQDYNGNLIVVNQCVAVAYDVDCYIGRVIAITSKEEMRIIFLIKKTEPPFSVGLNLKTITK